MLILALATLVFLGVGLFTVGYVLGLDDHHRRAMEAKARARAVRHRVSREPLRRMGLK